MHRISYAFTTYTVTVAINGIIRFKGQATHSIRKLQFEKEGQLRFPDVPRRLHTELARYKHGLGDGKGRVTRCRMKEKLTRTAAMMTFLWLTNEMVITPLEHRNVSY